MRRDYFTLDVRNVDWVETGDEARKPTVLIDFEGPSSTLRERLTGTNDELLDATETDVAFRLQGPVDDPETAGVVSVTNRITGDFVLELNEDADDVLKFIRAAREYGKKAGDADGRYHVEISIEGDDLVEYDKGTFLVYNSEGNLLRQHSLIPSGVEL
ncbi:DUF5793 family protein [Halorussus amylolyticus]|uniref:DUF5793 family protein n=1 Tax=Halorussus amylolyticus TaxID=1126242 RepID=UPI00104CFAEF|nr:DUF5793 family protein [Halorussus amylolyticus]